MNVVRAVCARALPALTSLDSRHPRLTHEGLWAVAGLTSLGGLGRGNRTCRCVLSERPISESPEGAEGAPPWCRLVVSAAHLRRKDTRVVVVAQPTFSRPATRPGELRLGSPTRRRRRQRPKATAARKSVILMKRSEIKAPVSFRLVEDAGTPQDASRWSTPPPLDTPAYNSRSTSPRHPQRCVRSDALANGVVQVGAHRLHRRLAVGPRQRHLSKVNTHMSTVNTHLSRLIELTQVNTHQRHQRAARLRLAVAQRAHCRLRLCREPRP
jgi:hypothetical protein